jgi:hypothetical protein
MKRRLFLNVVVGKSTTILELLASEDQALLIGRYALLVLDLRLDVIDGVGRLDLKCNGLARERLYEDLHTTTQTKDEMERRLLLNVVVGECATILELLASEDQALLVRGDALLVLNLGLDVVDGVRRLHLQSDGLPCEGLHENLHTTTQTEDYTLDMRHYNNSYIENNALPRWRVDSF